VASERPATGAGFFERRWPVGLTMLVVLLLLHGLPDRIRLAPRWANYAIWIVTMLSMSAVGLTRARPGWVRVERLVLLLFFLTVEIGAIVTLVSLTRSILGRSGELTGIQLLASSIAVWIANALTFSLLYWQLDRGGPEARVRRTGVRPDWLFPQDGAPEEVLSPGWQPGFVDYLALGYTTATAFSPTDTLPLTARAKLLMMFESTVSLVTVLIVAARAINVLGN
jgi:hypothetical protein